MCTGYVVKYILRYTCMYSPVVCWYTTSSYGHTDDVPIKPSPNLFEDEPSQTTPATLSDCLTVRTMTDDSE